MLIFEKYSKRNFTFKKKTLINLNKGQDLENQDRKRRRASW